MNYSYVLTSVVSFYANYIGISISLLHYYYNKRWSTRQEWKIQPEKLGLDIWERPRIHLVYWFINTLLGALNGIITYHFTMKNRFLQKDMNTQLTNVFYLHAAHTVFSYFWHRALHIPVLYKTFHKVHHHYKSPRPFDDLFFHPFEYGLYGWILVSPLFLIDLTPLEIILYLTPLGITGMLDHCGIKFNLGIYNTEHHDLHHEQFSYNFGFPFPFMDILFGTFKGYFANKYYNGKQKSKNE
eukprot:NODE_1061_length_1608_cov_0.273691.p1 type:complete len:241 gc:universal NODE_1061_length_1608_cov_0.273691:1386-664(-)